MSNLKLVVPENFRDFGERVDKNLRIIRNTDISYLHPVELPRFSNGEGKAVFTDSIRGMDVYVLTDVSNSSVTYPVHINEEVINHNMMPDEHFQDLKRILAADCGHAERLNVIMPYLYESRQDKRASRESLDCAIALQELAGLNVREIVTFDAHNTGIVNAIPKGVSFANIYPTDDLLFSMIKKEKVNFDELIVISPDEGAHKRAVFYSSMLGVKNVGTFFKLRDYSKVIDGKNPIKEHLFIGPEVSGMTGIVVDDMIASGGSILDTARKLKERGIKKVILIVTFALFNKGVGEFDKAFEDGIIDRVYATNLNYVPNYIKEKEWFVEVDCSMKVAHIIDRMNQSKPLSPVLNGKAETIKEIQKIKSKLMQK